MDNIGTGNEHVSPNELDLASSAQMFVDAGNNTITLSGDRLVKIEVQLGNTANPLAGGSALAITVKMTPVDTGDKCVFQQKSMNIPAGETLALISIDSFWAKSGSVIEVHAKSSAAGDSSVGGKVWIYDTTPGDADANSIVAALMAHSGFTAGGTMTYEELLKLTAGLIAGTWRDKPADATKQELLDADDNATILMEQTLGQTTPYKVVTIS